MTSYQNAKDSASKRKNEQMGLHHTENLLHSKRSSYQTQDTVLRMGENVCLLFIHKVLISRIYRELKKLNPQRVNIPMKKWAHELNKEFSKKEVQMASKYMKKCSTSLDIKEM
jgi:hypothetical protein